MSMFKFFNFYSSSKDFWPFSDNFALSRPWKLLAQYDLTEFVTYSLISLFIYYIYSLTNKKNKMTVFLRYYITPSLLRKSFVLLVY